MPIALIVLAITIFDKIDDALPDIVIFQRASEIDEFFLSLFRSALFVDGAGAYAKRSFARQALTTPQYRSGF